VATATPAQVNMVCSEAGPAAWAQRCVAPRQSRCSPPRSAAGTRRDL